MKQLIIGEKELRANNYKKIKEYKSIFEYDEWYECVCAFLGYRVFFEKGSKYGKKLYDLIDLEVSEKEIKRYVAAVVIENIEPELVVDKIIELCDYKYKIGVQDGKEKLQKKLRILIGINHEQ